MPATNRPQSRRLLKRLSAAHKAADFGQARVAARSGKSREAALEKSIRLEVAERIRSRRMSSGISQEELGNRAGLHRTYIGAVERSEKNITVVTLARLARALRCQLADLLPEARIAD